MSEAANLPITRSSESLQSWPTDLSHEPTLKIGDVIVELRHEFPLLAASKIRHYENLQLIRPHRTASNQRLFSVSDVERLRFILEEQRDHFLPLSQIKEMLRQFDSGEVADGVHPARMRVLPDNEVRRPQPGTRLTLVEVSDLTGVAVSDVEAMVKAGVLTADPRGRLTSQAPEIVRYAAMLLRQGYDLRQVRTVRTSAHAHAVMITSALASERAKKTPVAGERVINNAVEDAAVISHMYKALLAENLEVELR
ncbi:transcriptional regulator FtsR [Changpingibacter yushuensis]|uniref:transcriptional regulator FtsR n=1 Tax=Changpingibacter yushuensis TaxID=2758440 RepID=UPI00165D3FB3|nr:MerR family transcriptional regulator [Changpingibacter yushuensis]